MGLVLLMVQIHAALSGSSSYKSQYGTSVSAKGTIGHATLMKQYQQQLLRKEAGSDDDATDILGNESDIQSLADLDATLNADENKKSKDDSKDSEEGTASTDIANDLLDTKDSSKLFDDSKDSSKLLDDSKDSLDVGDASLDTKDAMKDSTSSDDAVKQTVALDELEQGAKDSQDSDLLKSLKADMAADNEAHGAPQKVESLDEAGSELANEDASFKSINSDLAELHNQVFGETSTKKDTPSLNSSVLEVAAAQKASDWLDKELSNEGEPLQNASQAHSWLDEEYAKLQQNQRSISQQQAVKYALEAAR
eukprot:gnl/MRDRNA2_/MRDRNA2_99035_c0_seq1.p1 gnl/MRDRNA2_/MRDRNA2_99035_c0~~gnl/MRDRNA2_/MRDRNA2_99035_c0_seq1.p1  ORF type:complete len:309 (-),score=98.26 gnl/MRDRNA2_/MRDRNA2_99035_c0_seq1:14-940(-)